MWRPAGLLCMVVLAGLAAPSSADPNVDVVWPTDLDGSYGERGEALAASLGLEARYVMFDASAWRDALEDTAYDGGRSSVTTKVVEPGRLQVDVLHPDGTAYRYLQPFDEFEHEVEAPVSVACTTAAGSDPDTSCAHPPPSYRIATGRGAFPAAMRIGVSFDVPNRITIEGPPGTFAAFGRGLEGARNITQQLGVPWNGTADDFVVHVRDGLDGSRLNRHTPWSSAPGLERIFCRCELYVLEGDDVKGAGGLSFVVNETGEILQFGSDVWLGERPIILAEADMLEGLKDELRGRGMDRFQHDGIELQFLHHDGLAWRVWTFGQGPDEGVIVERFVDATDGTMIAEWPVRTAGWQDPQKDGLGAWLWAALLVIIVAMGLVGWRGRRREEHEFVLPPPPPFEGQDDDDAEGASR